VKIFDGEKYLNTFLVVGVEATRNSLIELLYKLGAIIDV